MAITAMGLGTKTAPTGTNLDPQAQFWSFITAFMGQQASKSEGNNNHMSNAYFNGFSVRQNTEVDMSILIGGETGVVDSAALYQNGQCILLSTDGVPQHVTIPTAPAAGSRIDAIVSYLDKSSANADTETPGTPGYVKTIVVSGKAASSPSAPNDTQIKAKLPAGTTAYYQWCTVSVATGATNITNDNIVDTKPTAPNVYLAPQINNTLGDLLVTKRVSVYTRGDGQAINVVAQEAPNGYKFLCWIGVTTNGFVGVGYVSDWDRENTLIWGKTVDGSTGDFSLNATALYQKTQL